MNQLDSFHAMSPPQVHSQDYYVRIGERKLLGIRLEHLATVEDTSVLADTYHASLPGRKAGITEWHGVEDGQPISLGWDWTLLEDGDVRALRLLAPRTNVMLIDPKGYDIPEASSVPFIWKFIESLPWQRHVLDSIAGPVD